MMTCTVQKDARECATLCTENQASNNVSSAHVAVGNGTDLEAYVESLNEHIRFSNCFEWGICFLNSYWKPSREAPSAMSSAPHLASASSDFLNSCHQVTSDGDGVLHIAARFGNDKIVKEINTNNRTLAGVLLSAVNNRGDTTLHCAAAGGSNIMVKFFLEDMMRESMDPVIIAKFLRAQNIKGETCLHEAVRHGHLKIVETLLLEDKRIVDLNIEDLKGPMLVQIVDNEGISPLYLATTLRRIEIVRGLTKSPYNQDKYAVYCAGPAGKTALHAAVVLLDKGMYVNC
jgi:ankyrin repeat protein